MKGGVSIIIPVYNIAPELLRRALLSVSQQTFRDIEVLVVDDGSVPPIENWANAMFQHITPRVSIRLITLPANGGISGARNVGAKNSTKERLVWLDADDALHPRCVEGLVGASDGNDLV